MGRAKLQLEAIIAVIITGFRLIFRLEASTSTRGRTTPKVPELFKNCVMKATMRKTAAISMCSGIPFWNKREAYCDKVRSMPVLLNAVPRDCIPMINIKISQRIEWMICSVVNT